MKTAVTISLVEEARGGPFVFWDGLADGFAQAAKHGFDAVEIFAPDAGTVDRDELANLIKHSGLQVAAIGTGAGMVKHRLSLTDSLAEKRQAAIAFVRSMIEFGGRFNAPAIIGSMQGRWGDEVDKRTARLWLADALDQLGEYAAKFEVPLIYEPLNRYESNLINTLADAVDFINTHQISNVKLLADLFHMNIEETHLGDAIRSAATAIGHVHYVDSNRQAAGYAHTDFSAIAQALNDINYSGYLSAEVFPVPDSNSAAAKTMESIRRLF